MNRFLIAGCQRTGTTLMRLLLESHSRVECIDEFLSYQVLADRRQPPSLAADLANLVGFKIPVWTEQLLQPTLDGNELAFLPGLKKTPNFYRGEKIVFMTRSPYDTVSSMLRLKVDGKPWIQLCAPIISSKRSDPRFAEAFERELAIADRSDDRDVAFAAIYWKVKSSSLAAYQEAGMPTAAVSYERLVATPEPVLRGVVNFLELEWEDALLRHHEVGHPQVVAGSAIGGTNPGRPIDAASVGQWEWALSPAQVEIIRSIVHRYPGE